MNRASCLVKAAPLFQPQYGLHHATLQTLPSCSFFTGFLSSSTFVGHLRGPPEPAVSGGTPLFTDSSGVNVDTPSTSTPSHSKWTAIQPGIRFPGGTPPLVPSPFFPGIRVPRGTLPLLPSPLPYPRLGSTSLSSHAIADFPGARTEFTPHLSFVPESPEAPVPCFQVLDQTGKTVPGAEEYEIEQELALEMYRHMVRLQSMDTLFYEAQRQGRFSFYMTTAGEEAINIASAAGISNDDHIFAQYREPGVLLWRGYSIADFCNQCFGNELDQTRGRQMPIHYGSKALRFHTISSPLATQIPHAVGAAYGLKALGEKCCAVTYFGEGAASEGDFHAALNFAAVLEAPVLFICRNNGWAISTPAKEQYKGDGIAGRGQAYGVRAVRVDGNDTLAVLAGVREARRQVVEGGRPVILEALTYRTGHHSTSDDSSRYRGSAEIAHWKRENDPIQRFRGWLAGKGWWEEEQEHVLREDARREIIVALEAAEKLPKPPLSELFTDVYDKLPSSLIEQRRRIMEAAQRSPVSYPQDVPLK